MSSCKASTEWQEIKPFTSLALVQFSCKPLGDNGFGLGFEEVLTMVMGPSTFLTRANIVFQRQGMSPVSRVNVLTVNN
jgi:hypothetical protein